MEGSPTAAIAKALERILREILDGASPKGGWLLNRGDPGLLDSLDRLSADEASAVPAEGTSSVAAHVEHLRYGFSLLNRWTVDHNPFAGADWAAAWKRVRVTDTEWAQLRAELREEARRWREQSPKLLAGGDMEVTGAFASAAHLAYHLGAIRQMSRITRGPMAES